MDTPRVDFDMCCASESVPMRIPALRTRPAELGKFWSHKRSNNNGPRALGADAADERVLKTPNHAGESLCTYT